MTGEVIRVDDLEIIVDSADERRVKKVKVKKLEGPKAGKGRTTEDVEVSGFKDK